MGGQAPRFAHLPLISGLSKRKGSAGVFDYRDRGFVREAILNYLARLGWSHGDQELFSLEELCGLFSFGHVGKSNSEFDEQKFLWVNEQWLKRLELDDVAERWRPFLQAAGLDPGEDTERLRAICDLMRPRAQTLVEMAEGARYFFEDPQEFDEKAAKKWLKGSMASTFEELLERLEGLDAWDIEGLEALYRALCEEHDLGLGKLAQPTRVAVTGTTASPRSVSRRWLPSARSPRFVGCAGRCSTCSSAPPHPTKHEGAPSGPGRRPGEPASLLCSAPGVATG